MKKILTTALVICSASATFLAGCGIGSPDAATVGGTVTGMSGQSTLVLMNNAEVLVVQADGPFHFNSESNAAYNITVNAQPVGQTCTVANGSGHVSSGGANVTNVTVKCEQAVLVGGSVAGLAADTSVILQNNGADDVTVSANGTFHFTVPMANAATYLVTVKTQPVGSTCTVAHGGGTANTANSAASNNVAVTCVANTLGGTVTGLASGTVVVLQLNGGSDLTVSADGSFSFPGTLANATAYSVTIKTQPTGKTCSIANGTGVVDVSVPAASKNVAVTCI